MAASILSTRPNYHLPPLIRAAVTGAMSLLHASSQAMCHPTWHVPKLLCSALTHNGTPSICLVSASSGVYPIWVINSPTAPRPPPHSSTRTKHCTHQIHTHHSTPRCMMGMGSLAALAVLLLSFLAVGGAVDVGYDTADLTPSGAGLNDSDATKYWGPWTPARATWYGQPNGAGPDDNGGACGFKHTNHYPFASMTSCGNQPLFKDGKGCGSCYKIRCKKDQSCSGRTETVIITDMNYYPVAPFHFDLSGTAFGRLAKPGLNDKLRHSGIIDIEFTRVPCEFPGLKIGFHVEEYSNPVYFAVLVEYEDGDGDVVQVDLMESRGPGGGKWTRMRESWGSIWRLDSNHRLQAPFSIRIRNESGKTLVANKVIPANWRPNTFYRSFVQYS